ncbi:hypothetical protein IU412_10545 [Nocardia cyriacigeorgica]|nr:hypothetical protein [Nocardia cyriacigeorgica]
MTAVDPERAATGPYGTTIAHGYLSCHFSRSLVSCEFGSARIDYGSTRFGARRRCRRDRHWARRSPSPMSPNRRRASW